MRLCSKFFIGFTVFFVLLSGQSCFSQQKKLNTPKNTNILKIGVKQKPARSPPLIQVVKASENKKQKTNPPRPQIKIINPSEKPLPQIKVYKIRVKQSGNLVENVFTEIPVSHNRNVMLSREFGHVELVCNSEFPIMWEYLGVKRSSEIPILDARYKRITKGRNDNSSVMDFKYEGNNAFEGRVKLRGLYEFQTGKYVCKHSISEKYNSNYLNVFVPGERIFNKLTEAVKIQFKVIVEENVELLNSSEYLIDDVTIPCSVSDVNAQVKLFKLDDNNLNETGKMEWKSINGKYDPVEGFQVLAKSDGALLGTYKCSVDNGPSMIVIVAPFSALGFVRYRNIVEERCWESHYVMEKVRAARLACFCKNSALFTGNFSLEEMQQSECVSLDQHPVLLGLNCSDWRVNQFLAMGEESQDVCLSEKPKVDKGIMLRLRAMVNSRNSSGINLTVTFLGYDDWASGFKIGYRRNASSPIKMINEEPSSTQPYPLQYYRAVWTNIVLNSTEIYSLHVFQPDCFSFEWIEFSTKEFNGWSKENKGNNKQSLPQPQFHSSVSGTGGKIDFLLYINIFILHVLLLGLNFVA